MHLIRRAVLLAVLAVACTASAWGAGPTVAAASDLKFALDEIVALYNRAGARGAEARVVYGSSGNLARQIEQGAPFDLFMSADEAFVRGLAAKGLTVDDGHLYGIGRLVLYSPAEGFPVDERMEGLRQALAAGAIRRFAIANPEHAPYGRAAREALETAGLWRGIVGRLVLGENVSQAAQFAVSGNAQGGIFALSLALAPSFPKTGRHVVLPASMHQPLRQRMVVLKRAGPDGRRLQDFLLRAEARAIFTRYGFSVPAE